MSDLAVISRLCRDCVDGACVRACPVDCIYEERVNEEGRQLPNQLFVNPDECICCGACEPACPWEAIYDEPLVPDVFAEDITLNARTASEPDRFKVAEPSDHPTPSAEQVAHNKLRWETGITAKSA